MDKYSHRSAVASKTTFEALQVDSGEETEEEEVQEPVGLVAPRAASQEAPAKPTKSAQKKAARATRIELRKAANPKGLGSQTSSSDNDAVNARHGSAQDPVAILDEAATLSNANTLQDPVPDTSSHTPQTDTIHQAADLEQSTHILLPMHPTSDSSAPNDPGPHHKLPAPRPSPYRDVELAMQRKAEREVESTKKRQNVLTRTLWTFIMIGGFICLVLLGHAYLVLLVLLCQTLVYREVTALFSLKSATPDDEEIKAQGKDPWSKTLNWYFFAVTNYFLYGESIIYYFKHVVFADAQLLPFATNHRILSFTLYTIGFVGFVMSLKKGYLKQQFGLFCWVHMSLLLIVVSSHFIVNNILEGLIWFWVPVSLVICNDVFAYIWGITLGRTPLIKLSPKKTVEGFVGAFWSTIIFALVWGTWFMRYDYMICPVQDLGVSAWSSVACRPNPVFVWKEAKVWGPFSVGISTLLGRTVTTIPYATYQLHLLTMAFFASLVAPFGGFFASGFKRAFNVKDFGSSIPGHGGITDRMDCQFLMGVFTYVYYSSLVREHHVTVGGILQAIVSGLTVDEQLALIQDLRRYLEGQGIVVM